ncbi:MAG: ABC transporter permease [Nitrososphaeria archaeon]|jgi:ribose/xylose/arabinose/galactoside ABC-type transport system permease subunit
MKLADLSTEFTIIIMIVGCVAVVTYIEPSFFSYATFVVVAFTSAELGFIALGISPLIATGEIDLSAAAVLTLTLWVYDGFATGLSFSLPYGLIVPLLVAISIGFIQGYICLKMRIPAFIVTFVGMIVWEGIEVAITGGYNSGYTGITTGLFSKVLSGYIGKVPLEFVWFVVLTAIFAVIITRTPFGSHVLAVGGNETVARNLGVRVDRTKVLCFMISALMAGVTAIFFFNRQFYVSSTVYTQAPLFAICASVVGGNRAGHANMVGAALASILVIIIQEGMVMAGVPSTLYMAAVGIVLVIFATIHVKARKFSWAMVRRK